MRSGWVSTGKGITLTQVGKYVPLLRIASEWNHCLKCEIGCHAYRKVHFDCITDPKAVQADVLIIGEGPGKAEDALGMPFVGRSGKLLRETVRLAGPDTLLVGVTNLVACRPTDRKGGPNRPPEKWEMDNCAPHLRAIIEATRPIVVVCAGLPAQAYVPALLANMRYNATIHHVKHPAAVLRQGGQDSPYYNEYIDQFKDAFLVARTLLSGDQNAVSKS